MARWWGVPGRSADAVARGGPRVGVAAAAVLGLLLATPLPAAATVSGVCSVTGTSTSGGEIDLTNNAVWHVQSSDTITLAGTATSPQTQASVGATAFGFVIPISAGAADPSTSAATDPLDVATLALLGKVFLISGSSTGPDGSACDGQVQIIIDDVNPLTTGLGAGGVIAIIVGLLALLWGVRNPTGLPRRIIATLGMLVAGIGASVVIHQVVAPAAAEGGQAMQATPFVQSVVSPVQLSLDPTFLIQSSILGILILLLLPFPSQLFNSTLEANYDDIRAGVKRIPLVGGLVRDPTAAGAAPSAGTWRRPMVLAFVLVAGLLYGFVDPTFGLNETSLVLYVALVLGLVSVTWLQYLPSRAIHRSLASDSGRLWAVPSTLVVAAACVLISRVVGFLPGYLYGLIFSYTFLKTIEARDEGRAGALGAWWLLAAALVAWLTLGAVRIPGVEGTVPGTIAESILAAVVVSGIEGVVFALVPMKFLPGELVFRWQRSRWIPLYAIGLAGFLFILLNPANGYVQRQGSVSFVVALALFIGFGVVSLLFWGYFRLRTRARPANAA